MQRNIDPIIEVMLRAVEEHRDGPGAYARWRIQDARGSRNMKPSEYGVADAANILYTFGRFPREEAERAAFVRTLRGFQHDDGTFAEGTHHPLHSTAHCIAALELFDAGPEKPLTYHRAHFGDPAQMTAFLDSLGWSSDPWSESHKGAGLFAAMMLTDGGMPQAWQDAYFDWIAANADPVTGLGRAGAQDGQKNIFHHLAGWFHYMFNHVYAHRPFPYAERMTDSCIDIYDNRRFASDVFGRIAHFAEIDWVFLTNRSSMQTGYRRQEALARIRDFAEGYLDWMESDLETTYRQRYDDLHMLFGAVCCLSELQLALPGEIRTTIPMKNVLDRRPFI